MMTRSQGIASGTAGQARAKREPPPVPMIARWPLDVDDGFEIWHPADPWVALVKECLTDYRLGRADRASLSWAEDLVWRVIGGGPMGTDLHGAHAVFEYHRRLQQLSSGTYRQQLIALQASGGPIVEAHVRTVAARAGRRIEIPTLIVFELAGGRIKRVTEIPGDQQVWDGFWTD
jgi:ketosteroid isomerase-like protein